MSYAKCIPVVLSDTGTRVTIQAVKPLCSWHSVLGETFMLLANTELKNS